MYHALESPAKEMLVSKLETQEKVIIVFRKDYHEIYPDCCGFEEGEFCLACVCPCIAAGKVAKAAETFGKGTPGCILGCLMYCVTGPCMHGCKTAQDLRRKFPTGTGDHENSLNCVSHTFCTCCALGRELQYINNLQLAGVNMAGWPRRGPNRQVM